MTQQFKEFRIEDLFKEIVVGKQPNTTNRFKNHLNGMIPVITGVTMNNGIGFYSYPEDSKIYKNILTLSKDGEYAGKPFIQNSNVLLGGHSLGLIPKNDSKYMLMYVSSIFNKLLDIGFWKHGGVMGSVTLNKLREISLTLPITLDGELDFDYMDNYIKGVEQKYILNLRGGLDDKIANLLELTQKTEDNISDEHVQVLKERIRLDYSQKEFKEFKVGDIFQFRSIPQIPKGVGLVSKVDGIPYITQKSTGNGITSYINDTVMLEKVKEPMIVLGVDNIANGVCYWVDFDFYGNKLIGLVNENLNRERALYIITLLLKLYRGYSYNDKISKKIVENSFITLPVTFDGGIDYDFMGNYVRSLESVHIHDFRVCEEERIGLIEGFIR